MSFPFLKMNMRTRIGLVIFTIVVISVISGSFLLINRVTKAYEDELGNRVMAIAQSLAQSPTIREGLTTQQGWKVIQPLAERVRLVTETEYVVVFDMNRIRYSHPLEDRIGTPFRGGDEGPSLSEQAYISRAQGVEGASIRAFVPVMDDEGVKQVGVVVVGILVPTFLKMVFSYRLDLYLSLFIGIFIGLIGAWTLANRIKKQMLDMEPVEIARLVREREAMINSIGDGIIAIDRDEKTTLINEQAAKMLQISTNEVGAKISEVMPESLLPEVLHTGKPQWHVIQRIKDTVILTTTFPILVNRKIVGAVSTFQDRTELNRLAEELTGVKKFIEALRAQNHEYMNKLHTIAGLIQLRRYEEAIERILTFTKEQEELTDYLSSRIKEHSIAGLILGKISWAKEYQVELSLNPKSSLDTLPENMQVSDLLLIIGNLLENAIHAAADHSSGRKQVELYLFGNEDGVELVVQDTGQGISPDVQEQMFEYGYTTKEAKGQGIGLFLVKEYVDFLQGEIEVDSQSESGTRFTIILPAPQFQS